MFDFLSARFDNTRSLGNNAESLAQQFLEKHKLTFVSKNYQCRLGEIDLIMKDRDTLVFVEVRYRKNATFGEAVATIGPHKQKKIIKTAQYYLLQHQLTERIASRFDVVGITRSREGHKKGLDFNWIENAFY